MDALIGKGAISTGHFQRRDAFGQAAQGHGQVVVFGVEGGDAHLLGIGDDVLRADLVSQLDGDGVDRVGQGIAEGHGTAVGAAGVLRTPAAVGDGLVVHGRIRRHVVLQRRQVDEGLEGRTRLADSHAGAVEAILSAAADHGQDVARLGVDGDDGCLRLGQAVFVSVIVGQVAHGPDGGMLLVDVHGRVNLEAFLIEGIVAVFLGDLLGDVVDEGCIFVGFFGLMALGEAQVLVLGVFRFGSRYVAVFDHLVEDDVLALLGFVQVVEGRVVVRALRQAGQHGALRQGQFVDVFVEIRLGRCLDAIGTLAEVNLVHVHFQDFFFTVFVFDFQGQHGFLYLTLQCLFLGQEGVLGQLLGDGTAALGDAAVGQVGKDGAEDADRVDADVFIEAVVFGSDEGILQILRHFVDVDGQAVLIGMKGRDQPAVGIEDL